ncbi:acetoacetate decarboxylase [Paraburkholderia sp. JPY465]
MTETDVKERAFAMPLTSPAFPPGPYRFVDREFLIITYRTESGRTCRSDTRAAGDDRSTRKI